MNIDLLRFRSNIYSGPVGVEIVELLDSEPLDRSTFKYSLMHFLLFA